MSQLDDNKNSKQSQIFSSKYQKINKIRKYISIVGIVFGLLIMVWAGYKFNIEYSDKNSTALYREFSAIFNILLRGGAGLLVLLTSIAIFFISVSNTARKN